MNQYEYIVAQADEMKDRLTATRRDFHKYAEAGWMEIRTSSLIARKLADMGYEVLVGEQVCKRESRMGVPDEKALDARYETALSQGADPEYAPYMKGGMTGVIGILRCGEGPTVACRFDIDALGVYEDENDSHRPTHEQFASVHNGVMHACGHDGHATIGLGVAKILMGMKENLHGTVKLIFQPAEEGVRGAKAIVDNGNLDGVQYFLASHITDKAEDDPAVVIPGSYGSLATTKYDAFFQGVSAHAGGSPEKGKNVMLAVATAILNLYAIPRHSGGVTRMNVGKVIAGSGRNVIADSASMEIELRGETTEINQFVEDYAKSILESSAKMHGCTCELKLMGSAHSLTSDAVLIDRVRKVCEQDLKLPVAKMDSSKNGGSEDVSYMMNRVQEQGGQATFMRVLTKTSAPGHNRRFDFDESVLPNAVKIFCGVIYDILS
ncbi:MAG: M20 family metallo-hydrolase [Lachnospiraceae bacterium]|nr:M20 family metallo-hydrolase [Lachnospiraceae bacterium]